MFNRADIVCFLLIFIFLIIGLRKGIVKTIIGPLATVISMVAAYLFFKRGQNPLMCLSILFGGPFLVSIIFSSILKITRRRMDPNQPVMWFSSLLGGAFNLIWGTGMVALVLIFTAVMPQKIFKFQEVQKSVLSSFSYAFLQQTVLKKVPVIGGFEDLLKVYQDPKRIKQIQSTPGYQEIYNDERIQDLLSDEETVKMIQEKDIMKLMTNPKIINIWQDGEFIQKILEVNAESLKLTPQDKKALEKQLSPKVYELKYTPPQDSY